MSLPPAEPVASTSRAQADISAPPLMPDNDLQSAATSQQRVQTSPVPLSSASIKSRSSLHSVKGKERWNGEMEEGEEEDRVAGGQQKDQTTTGQFSQTPSSQPQSIGNTTTLPSRPSSLVLRSPNGPKLAAPPQAHVNPSPSRSPDWLQSRHNSALDKQPATLSFALPEPNEPHLTPRQHTQLFSIASSHDPGAGVSAGPLETRGLTTGGGAGTNWTTRSWKASTIGGFDKKRLQALGFEEELSESALVERHHEREWRALDRFQTGRAS